MHPGDTAQWMPSLSSPLPYSRSLVSPGKETVHSYGGQETPLDHLILEGSGISAWGSTGLYSFANFKRSAI